jgi:hypothetical protein
VELVEDWDGDSYIKVTVDTGHLHLFDAGTGERVGE